ncbi:phosphate signaling complex PhoU family protein, partial [Caldithrix abyssi]
AMHRSLYQLVAQKLSENPQKAAIYLQYISISRYLERIADLATNIAEDVIYMVEGTIARHNPEKFQ